MITALHAMLRLSMAAACVAVFSGTPADASQVADSVTHGAALSSFTERVEEYAALHQRLEGPLPPLSTMQDMRTNLRAQQLLASAIRRERPNARQGDIFSLEVASAFARSSPERYRDVTSKRS